MRDVQGFTDLDAKIEAGMKAHSIPGVAVAVWAAGEECVKGDGVRLPDLFHHKDIHRYRDHTAGGAGVLDLDAPVRRYLPDLAVADTAASATATVPELYRRAQSG